MTDKCGNDAPVRTRELEAHGLNTGGYESEPFDIKDNLKLVLYNLTAECENDLQVKERKEAAMRHASRALQQAEQGVDTF